ncbi:MAG TPA: amidohydrolase family protein [Terriglobales bacterium]|nr:amidohydrolase family protein [Terriglobales bacterium]
MKFDLLIKNAKLQSTKLCDIGISSGRIESIAQKIDSPAEHELDAHGNLVSEPFVIAHLHLDKVLTGSLADEATLEEYHGGSMNGAMTAIELASKVKEHYVESEIVDRVRRVLTDAEFYGVTALRAFADVDTKARLTGIKALLKVKEEFKDRIGIQIVAFPQDGIIREPGAEELLYKAMDLGANLIGGIPWIELTDDDARQHVDIAFEIAKKYEADVAMLTDDAGDPDLRTTEYLATSAIKNDRVGRVTACHARATGLYNEVHHRKFAALLRNAGVGVVTDPHTGPLHVKVKELLNAGVTVAMSQDDVYDAYYPYGRCNMLEVAFLGAHLLWMMSRDDRETLYDMITTNAARILRLKGYEMTVGNNADMVVLNASDLRDAFAYHSEPLYVIRKGQVACETHTERVRK